MVGRDVCGEGGRGQGVICVGLWAVSVCGMWWPWAVSVWPVCQRRVRWSVCVWCVSVD